MMIKKTTLSYFGMFWVKTVIAFIVMIVKKVMVMRIHYYLNAIPHVQCHRPNNRLSCLRCRTRIRCQCSPADPELGMFGVVFFFSKIFTMETIESWRSLSKGNPTEGWNGSECDFFSFCRWKSGESKQNLQVRDLDDLQEHPIRVKIKM